MAFTNIHVQRDVMIALRDALSLLQQSNSKRVVYAFNGIACVSSNRSTAMRHIIAGAHSCSALFDRVMLSLKDACIIGEIEHGCPAVDTLNAIDDVLQHITTLNASVNDVWQASSDCVRAQIDSACVGFITHDDIKRIVFDSVDDKRLCAVVTDAIISAGVSSTIAVSHDDCDHDHVVTELGYSFKHTWLRGFHDRAFRDASTIIDAPRIIVIDGAVVDHVDVDALLNASITHGVAFIVIARYFSDAVIDALASRYVHKANACVIPVCVPIDEDALNALKDITVVSGAMYVSSLAGCSMASLHARLHDVASLHACDRVVFDSTTLRIMCDASHATVLQHIKHIRHQISADMASQEMQSRRICALSSCNLLIMLARRFDALALLLREQVECTLRYVRACISYGVIHANNRVYAVQSLIASYALAAQFLHIWINADAAVISIS